MKILHLRASNFYGGPERQLHYHARLARRDGIELTIGSFSEQGQTPEFLGRIAEDGIPTHTFRVAGAYDRSAVATLRQFLLDNGFDILCTHDYRTHAIGFLAVRGQRIRWIAFSRGWTRENLKIRLFHTLDKVIVRFADHIVAVSAGQKEKLRRLLIPEQKITVALNAIDISLTNGLEPVDLRKKYGLPQDAIIVAAGGRLSAEKGQACLIDAAAIALKTNPRLRFVLFGDGVDLPRLTQQVADLGLNTHLLLPGFERNLLPHLAGADIVVNPSLSEGLPNIVLEAMALGLPVVATAVGGVPEIITSDRCGRLVPPADAAALAEAIMAVAGNTELAASLGRAGKQRVTEHFSFQSQYNDLKAIYDRVIQR